MPLSKELLSVLIAHKGDNIETIAGILNKYDRKQSLYNRLNGEDILNAYKLTGVCSTPDNTVVGYYKWGK